MTLTELGREMTLQEVREGVNENFSTLEERLVSGLAEKAEIVVGSYTGDDEGSQLIVLGFRPKAVFVARKDGMAGDTSYKCGGFSTPVNLNSENVVRIKDTGFQVIYNANLSSYSPYVFLALR